MLVLYDTNWNLLDPNLQEMICKIAGRQLKLCVHWDPASAFFGINNKAKLMVHVPGNDDGLACVWRSKWRKTSAFVRNAKDTYLVLNNNRAIAGAMTSALISI